MVFDIDTPNNMGDPGLRPPAADDLRHGLGVNTHAMTRKSAELARGEIARLMRAPGAR